MIIGNPLYDSIFKYLLQDTKAAKKFVGLIINEEIIDLKLNPQEHAREKNAEEQIKDFSSKPALAIYRLDFSATIRTAQGSTRHVLIEVQKAKEPADIIRFRKYLGHQYQTAHTAQKAGTEAEPVLTETEPLPIISIYILGFKVSEQPVPVIKANNQYTDVLYGQPVDAHIDFIAWLSHDVYVIQTPYLRKSLRTPLEQLLTLFDQSRTILGTDYLLNLDLQFADEGLQYIAKRLEKVAADPELQQQIDDEFYQTYNKKVWLHQLAKAQKKQDELTKQNDQLALQKEELSLQKDELAQQKDELTLQKDELTQQKDELTQQKDELTQQKEEAEQKRHEAETRITNAILGLHKTGMPATQIAQTLQLPLDKVNQTINKQTI